MDQSTFDAIIQRIISGESTATACAALKMSTATLYKSMSREPLWQTEYLRARAYKAEAQVDEIVEIADTDNDPQRARNRIDARKWQASKLLPRQYGDKLQVDVNETRNPAALHAEALRRLRSMRDQREPALLQHDDAEGESLDGTTDNKSANGTIFD